MQKDFFEKMVKGIILVTNFIAVIMVTTMMLFYGLAVPAMASDGAIEMKKEAATVGVGRRHIVDAAETIVEDDDTVVDLYTGSDQQKQYEALSYYSKVLIDEISSEYGVDAALVKAICYNETQFQPTLTHMNANGTTDWGIAQCNDMTFEYLHENIGISKMQDLLDMETGIKACCSLLAYYQNVLGTDSAEQILLAYQEGLGNYFAVVNGEQEPWDSFEKTYYNYVVFSTSSVK